MVDAKAQHIIVTSVTSHYQVCGKNYCVYMNKKSNTSITLIQQKFYSYVMDINDNIAQRISKLENLSRQLTQLGEPISDSMLITKI